MKVQIYTINVRSRFILTQQQIKKSLGVGYEVLSIETAKDVLPIIDIDSAAQAIINTGYRALARAYHPDLGGNENTMKVLNQTKRELMDLLKSIEEVK
jgi:hypothetical protein